MASLNISPELREVEEDEMGARLSRLEDLVGNLVRAVENQRVPSAPVARGECVPLPVRSNVVVCCFFGGIRMCHVGLQLAWSCGYSTH